MVHISFHARQRPAASPKARWPATKKVEKSVFPVRQKVGPSQEMGKKEIEKKSGVVKRMRHSKIDEKKVAKNVLTLY